MIVLCGFEQLEATAKTGDRFRISFHIAAFSFFFSTILLLSTIILYSDGLNFKTSYFAEGDEEAQDMLSTSTDLGSLIGTFYCGLFTDHSVEI